MKKKCVFIGESFTGKTAIFYRILQNNFLDNRESTSVPSNNHVSFVYKKIILKLELWDTIGQEKFRSVNKLFYKGADICFLVYSIDMPESLKALKEYWVPTIHSLLGEKTALCVVANKIDLFDAPNVVEESEGKEFAESINSSFVSVSAKTGFGFPDVLEAGLESYYHYHSLPDPPKPIKDNQPETNEPKKELGESIKLDKDINTPNQKNKFFCIGNKKKKPQKTNKS